MFYKMSVLCELVCIVFCVLLAAGIYESTPVNSKINNDSLPLSAIDFMKKYGYLESGTADSEALYKKNAITEAISTFQKFGNIPITGKLDNATLEFVANSTANWTSNLGEEAVMDEVEKALNTWSGYSRPNFKRSRNSNADIFITFGRGPHGDDVST